MEAKDKRMNETNEALDNIYHIKFNSLIDKFIDKIYQARLSEEE